MWISPQNTISRGRLAGRCLPVPNVTRLGRERIGLILSCATGLLRRSVKEPRAVVNRPGAMFRKSAIPSIIAGVDFETITNLGGASPTIEPPWIEILRSNRREEREG